MLIFYITHSICTKVHGLQVLARRARLLYREFNSKFVLVARILKLVFDVASKKTLPKHKWFLAEIPHFTRFAYILCVTKIDLPQNNFM